ncbi:MAG: DegQ family serine endoprotease [Pararhizobium sp.]
MKDRGILARLALALVLVVSASQLDAARAADGGHQGLVTQIGALFGGSKDGSSGDSSDRQVPATRQQIQLSFAPLVKKTAPAVVNVYATRMVRQASPFGGDPFFERFFGQQFPQRARKESALGSGVIVDPKGLIVTNYHVIKDADEVKVALDDGREFQCDIVLKDQKVDLAVLKIKGSNGATFPTLPIGDSDKVEIGDLVLAIGNPFGVGQTVTSGIISAVARTRIGKSAFGYYLQTDAAINPGNSGGGLIDVDGNLVGINSAIYSPSGGSNGIGFAIPSNLVRSFVQAAEAGDKHFELPYIGATFEPVTADIAEALGLKRFHGALVDSVAADGPAAKAGLKVGDVVTELNGETIQHPDELGYRLATTGIGKTAKLTVVSQNSTRTVTIALERAPETVPADRSVIKGNNPFAGAEVANLSPRVAEDIGMQPDKTGVVVTSIQDGSPALQVGLQPQDIIVSVNGNKIGSVKDLEQAVGRDSGMWRFDIDRDGQIIRQILR